MTRRNADAVIVDVHIKGKVAEVLATAFNLKQKCHVFNNASAHGPFDVVVVNRAGETILVDVKSVTRRTRDNSAIHRSPTKIQKRVGVMSVYVDVDKKEDRYLKRRKRYRIKSWTHIKYVIL